MKFRIPALAALVGVLGLGSFQDVSAQPIAPMRSPGFTPFMGVMGRGGGAAAGYYGMVRPNVQMQMLQAEMFQANANLANMQTAMSSMVSAGLPQTGRGAVFMNLSHWYPSSRYGSGGGGGMMGPRYGMTSGMVGMAGMGMSSPSVGVGVVAGGFRR